MSTAAHDASKLKSRYTKSASGVTVVSADWLLPVMSPPVRNGALAMQNGIIIDLGLSGELQEKYKTGNFVQKAGVLMPGLVNAHTHLELSVFGSPVVVENGQHFVDWIRALLQNRTTTSWSTEDILVAAKKELRRQKEQGVLFIADTGNEHLPVLCDNHNHNWPDVYRMVEMIAPNSGASQAVIDRLKEFEENVPVTAHAPYSTNPDILRLIKKRCSKFGHVFSIHTSESSLESSFISRNSGPFREFLEERNSWDATFRETGLIEEGTVEYYGRLGLLDNKTLLVHCVHVTEHEIELIAQAEAHVCLCPGSNKFLHVGKAPVVRMVKRGILPAIGTDSLASNPDLNMWLEMKILAEDHDELPHEMILGMATLGGAKVFGLDSKIGSLAIGRRARLLSVQDDFARTALNSDVLLAQLVTGGKPDKIEWLSFN